MDIYFKCWKKWKIAYWIDKLSIPKHTHVYKLCIFKNVHKPKDDVWSASISVLLQREWWITKNYKAKDFINMSVTMWTRYVIIQISLFFQGRNCFWLYSKRALSHVFFLIIYTLVILLRKKSECQIPVFGQFQIVWKVSSDFLWQKGLGSVQIISACSLDRTYELLSVRTKLWQWKKDSVWEEVP